MYSRPIGTGEIDNSVTSTNEETVKALQVKRRSFSVRNQTLLTDELRERHLSERECKQIVVKLTNDLVKTIPLQSNRKARNAAMTEYFRLIPSGWEGFVIKRLINELSEWRNILLLLERALNLYETKVISLNVEDIKAIWTLLLQKESKSKNKFLIRSRFMRILEKFEQFDSPSLHQKIIDYLIAVVEKGNSFSFLCEVIQLTYYFYFQRIPSVIASKQAKKLFELYKSAFVLGYYDKPLLLYIRKRIEYLVFLNESLRSEALEFALKQVLSGVYVFEFGQVIQTLSNHLSLNLVLDLYRRVFKALVDKAKDEGIVNRKKLDYVSYFEFLTCGAKVTVRLLAVEYLLDLFSFEKDCHVLETILMSIRSLIVGGISGDKIPKISETLWTLLKHKIEDSKDVEWKEELIRKVLPVYISLMRSRISARVCIDLVFEYLSHFVRKKETLKNSELTMFLYSTMNELGLISVKFKDFSIWGDLESRILNERSRMIKNSLIGCFFCLVRDRSGYQEVLEALLELVKKDKDVRMQMPKLRIIILANNIPKYLHRKIYCVLKTRLCECKKAKQKIGIMEDICLLASSADFALQSEMLEFLIDIVYRERYFSVQEFEVAIDIMGSFDYLFYVEAALEVLSDECHRKLFDILTETRLKKEGIVSYQLIGKLAKKMVSAIEIIVEIKNPFLAWVLYYRLESFLKEVDVKELKEVERYYLLMVVKKAVVTAGNTEGMEMGSMLNLMDLIPLVARNQSEEFESVAIGCLNDLRELFIGETDEGAVRVAVSYNVDKIRSRK